VAVPTNCLIPLPEGLSVNDAVLAEPLATSVSVLAASSSAANVVVVGCGAIGLLALHTALYGTAGTRVCVEVADPVAARRRVAVELGAARAFPSVNGLRAAAADLVIDAVGTEETWTGAVRAVRPGGTVAVIGLGQVTGSVPMGHVVRAGITIRGSFAYSRRDFERALALLAARPLRTANRMTGGNTGDGVVVEEAREDGSGATVGRPGRVMGSHRAAAACCPTPG
jgi:threonine dehydrogenase-like Zn-dependent dehydrogenase